MKTENKFNLTIKKPVAFIKVHTTGLNPETDRIIEFSMAKVMPDGSVKSGTRRFNPGIPIPKEVIVFNGITDEMVKDSPTFQEVAQKINEFLGDCDFAGFSIRNFDLRFLSEEFNRAGIEFTVYGRNIIDLSVIYHSMEPRDFRTAAKYYCGSVIESGAPIPSEKVTNISIDILNSMCETYNNKNYVDKKGETHEFQSNIEVLNDLFNENKKSLDIKGHIILNENGKPVLNVGQQYKGRLLSEIAEDKKYCNWFIKESSMPADTKIIFKRIIAKVEAAAVANK